MPNQPYFPNLAPFPFYSGVVPSPAAFQYIPSRPNWQIPQSNYIHDNIFIPFGKVPNQRIFPKFMSYAHPDRFPMANKNNPVNLYNSGMSNNNKFKLFLAPKRLLGPKNEILLKSLPPVMKLRYNPDMFDTDLFDPSPMKNIHDINFPYSMNYGQNLRKPSPSQILSVSNQINFHAPNTHEHFVKPSDNIDPFLQQLKNIDLVAKMIPSVISRKTVTPLFTTTNPNDETDIPDVRISPRLLYEHVQTSITDTPGSSETDDASSPKNKSYDSGTLANDTTLLTSISSMAENSTTSMTETSTASVTETSTTRAMETSTTSSTETSTTSTTESFTTSTAEISGTSTIQTSTSITYAPTTSITESLATSTIDILTPSTTERPYVTTIEASTNGIIETSTTSTSEPYVTTTTTPSTTDISTTSILDATTIIPKMLERIRILDIEQNVETTTNFDKKFYLGDEPPEKLSNVLDELIDRAVTTVKSTETVPKKKKKKCENKEWLKKEIENWLENNYVGIIDKVKEMRSKTDNAD